MENKSFTPEIYKRLLEAVDKLPKEAVERSKGVDTRKGYDTTGYQYQFLVNILNEVVGVPNWFMKYQIVKEIEGKWADKEFNGKITAGQRTWEITVDMEITILDAVRNSAGGHKSALHCDALKGAITSALKKTLGLFGVGKKAYEGTIDDDYKPLPDEPTTHGKVSIPPTTKPGTTVRIPGKSADVNDLLDNTPSIKKTDAEKVADLIAAIKKQVKEQKITVGKFDDILQNKCGLGINYDYENFVGITDLSVLDNIYSEILRNAIARKK